MTTNRSLSPGAAEVEGPRRGGETLESACLTTDEILELLLGTFPETRRETALKHVAACTDCRILFSSAAEAIADTGPIAPSSPVGVFKRGVLVASRYRVERFIARGGMGEVYAVSDEVLNERIALKTVRSEPPTDVKAIRRLKSEALLSRRIGHTNVCRIFDFGEHGVPGGETVCFLTMELVEGETLGARLRRDGPLPIKHVNTILRQVLGGLAEAHALGIVHRDLKSDNIMLREPKSSGASVDAVVMDFGLAFRVDTDDRLTSDIHALVGSAAYMSPEQVEGQRLTSATDVYALGVILFEMLTGQLPFRAGTRVSTAMQRLHTAPPLPSSLRPELEPYWDHLVMGCLQRAIEKRFGSASEVMTALDRLKIPVAVRFSASSTQARSGVSTQRALSIVGLALVLGLMFWAVAATTPWSTFPLNASPQGTRPLQIPLPPLDDDTSVVPEPRPAHILNERTLASPRPDIAAPGMGREAERAKSDRQPKKSRKPAERATHAPAVQPLETSSEAPVESASHTIAHDGIAPEPMAPNTADPLGDELAAPSPLEPLPLDPEFPE